MPLIDHCRYATYATLAVVAPVMTVQAEARYPAIPEPMIFDMMRPLGARQGELEANVLAVSNEPFRPRHAEWAPEVEYAFADGKAIEVELPFDGGRLAAFKVGLQAALGASADGRTAHGFQYLGIHDRRTGRYSNTMLYMNGHRFSRRWSMIGMVGLDEITLSRARGERRRDDGNGRNALLLNQAAFYDVRDGTVLGAEVNIVRGTRRHVRVSPQLHQRVTKAVAVQVALGMEKDGGHAVRPVSGVRLIREF